MTPHELIQTLNNTQQTLSEMHMKQLAAVLDEFPYFQPARAIYLKGLKQRHDFSYNAQLKKTAAYTIDRSILFEYITSEEFNQHKIAEQLKKVQQQNQDSAEEDYDQALKTNIQEANRVLDPALFEKTPEKEKPLQTGLPLSFNKNESHSFSEWLKIAQTQPIERTSETTVPSEEKSRKFKLIDAFIAKNPKIVPSKENSEKKFLPEEKKVDSRLMTETLAQVYLEQKNYTKAIQAYKILILKNPEKSGFFADQIRAIEKLQENKRQ